MAGEIEEHFSLDFKADCFHSGSISFGRFESEALCWERRSSFSRNRYLEEVEKCSTPGLVIEKKAYFEAHFKKKGGILGQNETEHQTSDINDRSEKAGGSDGEISRSPRFDESLDGSSRENENTEMQQEEVEEFDSSNLDSQIEFLCDSADNLDSVSEHWKVEEANLESVNSTREKLDGETAKSDTSDASSNLTTGLFDDHHEIEEKSDASRNGQGGSSSKETNSSQPEYMRRRVSNVSQSTRCIAPDKATKGLGKKPSKTVNNVSMRPKKSDKKTSEASAQDECPKHKTRKYDQPGKKANGVKEIKRGEKESRNRVTDVSQSSTLRKLPSRVHQSENRIKAAVSASQPCIKQESSRFRFKCNERAERRREFDMKIEKRMHVKEAEMHQLQAKTRENSEAEIKQLRERLNFKATPLPSFCRGVVHDSDRNKIKSSRTASRTSESSRLSSKSSKHDTIRVLPKTLSDPPQASGGTSCHSTVTSDSSPSSPAAEISNRVGLRKQKEEDKRSLPKHKASGGNKMIDGTQKKRTDRGLAR